MKNGRLDAHIVVQRGPDFTLDIHLEIEAGTTAALLGPNGAGKSTTVDALSGILPLDDGRIAIAGRDLDVPAENLFVAPEDRQVGVVFQDYLLFEHLDVRDNVAFGPRSTGMSTQQARAAATVVLEKLDIAELATRATASLSGGQRQRVALARAMAANPAMLLLDEPLAALDVQTRTQLRRNLQQHLETFDGPRLLITHDPADAFLLADKIYILENGQLGQTGTSNELRLRPATPYAAAFAGVNLLSGRNDAGTLQLDEFDVTLSTSNTQIGGAVLITIHPNAIALHANQPDGSPRNAWRTTVKHLEPLGDITRVMLDLPLPLSVDVTPGAVAALSLAPGVQTWASVKATEVQVSD